MPCRIDLRHDQSSSDIPSSSNPNVCIYAPSWVKEGLEILTDRLHGIQFEVHDKNHHNTSNNTKSKVIDSFTIDRDKNPLNLKLLQIIARCEPRNVTGVIEMGHYAPDLTSAPDVIYALRDLVRQCIIVGLDETTHYGGYPSGQRHPQSEPVYIVDLAGLQFQQAYNTGRLVLVKEPAALPQGALDNFIYEHVVGEHKKTFHEIDSDKSHHHGPRFVKYVCTLPKHGHHSHHIHSHGVQLQSHGGLVQPQNFAHDAYFDSKAYRRFVASDVVLAGIVLNELATSNSHQLNFKFLKYGTGYFAGNLKEHLEHHILPGVLDGLETLYHDYSPLSIKSIELPFYREDTKSHARLEHLKNKYKIDVRFTHEDALKCSTKGEGWTVATTNCGDPHAACGNEMGFGSVDGAIAENLKSKGNIFCPLINTEMSEKFVDVIVPKKNSNS